MNITTLTIGVVSISAFMFTDGCNIAHTARHPVEPVEQSRQIIMPPSRTEIYDCFTNDLCGRQVWSVTATSNDYWDSALWLVEHCPTSTNLYITSTRVREILAVGDPYGGCMVDRAGVFSYVCTVDFSEQTRIVEANIVVTNYVNANGRNAFAYNRYDRVSYETNAVKVAIVIFRYNSGIWEYFTFEYTDEVD